MKYYVLPIDMLKKHGMGEESWRKRKGDKVLANEAEITDRIGYASSREFETEEGFVPMSLKEAIEWSNNQ